MMTAYEIAQSIALAVLIVLGLAGLNEWFIILTIAMIVTAGVHEITGDTE